MKKCFTFTIVFALIFLLFGCGGDALKQELGSNIDYKDAESFEEALNNGEKVKGKTVRLYVKEYAPDSILGINCHAGEHLNFLFENEIDVEKGDTIVVRITEEPSKVFLVGSWKVPCELVEINKAEKETEGNTEAETAPSDTEINNDNKETDPPKVVLTMSAADFDGMNYQEAEQKFREMGFTKFKYSTIDIEHEPSADTICYIMITEAIFGYSDFAKGDQFDPDSTVTFYYYKYIEPAKPSPVFYSTNDYETAKKGNTGVFSYRDRGESYDIYWIIDFDEGYVYCFTDSRGGSHCDRLKIDSGTLNDAITITYHDGNDTWSYRLHFKYVNQPETLVVVDQNGFAWEYSTTDLDDALIILNTKTIKDY